MSARLRQHGRTVASEDVGDAGQGEAFEDTEERAEDAELGVAAGSAAAANERRTDFVIQA